MIATGKVKLIHNGLFQSKLIIFTNIWPIDQLLKKYKNIALLLKYIYIL